MHSAPACCSSRSLRAGSRSGRRHSPRPYVVERLPANVAGLSSLVIPLAGIAFAWLLLGERPSLVEGCGIVLIASALAIVNLRRAPKAVQT
jgi:hypothetical protein